MNTFIENGRITLADKRIDSDIIDDKFENHLFLRLVAKEQRFTKVSFKYSIFDNSYLRKCEFDSCDFTGCKFIGTNFTGSTFTGCKFDYAIFERTNITSDILNTECPPYENVKKSFAQSLRVNYQQIGDSKSVNKAVNVELQATINHLYKEWNSNESYYRKKYTGLNRIRSFLKWLEFHILDFIWGNGESIVKMFRGVFFVLLFIACYDMYISNTELSLGNFLSSLCNSFPIFLGVFTPEYYSNLHLSIIVLVRVIAVSFLISIIIKRFNRR